MSDHRQILEHISHLVRRPAVIAIDGQSGSGKSTLARRLQEELGSSAQIIQGDDFYRDMPEEDRARLSPAEGFQQYFDWQRMKSQVLDPARSGAQTLRYQKYDWDNAKLGEWMEVPTPEILILESVYSHRPESRVSPTLVYMSRHQRQSGSSGRSIAARTKMSGFLDGRRRRTTTSGM
jgi:uridine kinase